MKKKPELDIGDIKDIINHNIWQMPLSLFLLFLDILSYGNEIMTVVLAWYYVFVVVILILVCLATIGDNEVFNNMSDAISKVFYSIIDKTYKIDLLDRIIISTSTFHVLTIFYCVMSSFIRCF